MTEFYIHPKNFGRWFHQNEATAMGDFIYGCLLDNFILATKRGYAFIYEKYCNEWESCYHIIFAPYSDKSTVQDLFSKWYEFEKESKKETDEE